MAAGQGQPNPSTRLSHLSSWQHTGAGSGEGNYTLSLRSHKNLSLCALLCMNTPSKCPVSTDRISIAFSPQPIIWLDRMYALERKHSTQPIRTGRGQGGTEKAEEYTDMLVKNYLHVHVITTHTFRVLLLSSDLHDA